MNRSGKLQWSLAALVVLGIATSAYFYLQLQTLKNDPAKIEQEETQKLVERVGRLILLPADETPSVATVADPAALASQPFFANAEKGDKVLLYTNAKKAILYRPLTDKIVEVAPVNLGSGAE